MPLTHDLDYLILFMLNMPTPQVASHVVTTVGWYTRKKPAEWTDSHSLCVQYRYTPERILVNKYAMPSQFSCAAYCCIQVHPILVLWLKKDDNADVDKKVWFHNRWNWVKKWGQGFITMIRDPTWHKLVTPCSGHAVPSLLPKTIPLL